MPPVCPRRSVTRNIGTHGGGTRVTEDNKIYDARLRRKPVNVCLVALKEDKARVETLRRHYRKNSARGLPRRALRKLNAAGDKILGMA